MQFCENSERTAPVVCRGWGMPDVSPWVIGLGWDQLGFPVRLDINEKPNARLIGQLKG